MKLDQYREVNRRPFLGKRGQQPDASALLDFGVFKNRNILVLLLLLLNLGFLSASSALESNSDVAHKTIQEFNDPLDSLLLTLDIDSLQNVLSSSEIYYGLKNLSYEQKKQLAERVIFRENNFGHIPDAERPKYGANEYMYMTIREEAKNLTAKYDLTAKGEILDQNESAILQTEQLIRLYELIYHFNYTSGRYRYNTKSGKRDVYKGLDPRKDDIGKLGEKLKDEESIGYRNIGFFTTMYLDESMSIRGSYNSILKGVNEILQVLSVESFSLIPSEFGNLQDALFYIKKSLERDFENIDYLEELSIKEVSKQVFLEDLKIPENIGFNNDFVITQKNRGGRNNYEIRSPKSIVLVEKNNKKEGYTIQAFSRVHGADYFAGSVPLNKNYKNFLSVLGFSDSQIADIYDDIAKKLPLEKLFNGNSLTIQGLSDIQIDVFFDMRSKGQLHASKNIPSIEQVIALDFSRLGLSSLPDEVALMSNLESIDFSGNRISIFPSQLQGLAGLQVINGSDNDIEYLPGWIGDNQSLTDIDLPRNKIRNLPQSITQLNNLETLSLSNNPLQSLPENIGRLRNLKALNVSSTAIRFLPSSLDECLYLTYLGIVECKDIMSFPPLPTMGSLGTNVWAYDFWLLLDGTPLRNDEARSKLGPKWSVSGGRNQQNREGEGFFDFSALLAGISLDSLQENPSDLFLQLEELFSQDNGSDDIPSDDMGNPESIQGEQDHLGRESIDDDITTLVNAMERGFSVSGSERPNLGNSLPDQINEIGSVEITVSPELDGLYRENVYFLGQQGDSTVFVSAGLYEHVSLPQESVLFEYPMSIEFSQEYTGEDISLPIPLGIAVVSYKGSGELFFNKKTNTYRIKGGSGVVTLGLQKDTKSSGMIGRSRHKLAIGGSVNGVARRLGYRSGYEKLNAPQKVDEFMATMKERFMSTSYYGFEDDLDKSLSPYKANPQQYALQLLLENNNKHRGEVIGTCNSSAGVTLILAAEWEIPVRYVEGRIGINGAISKIPHAWIEYRNGKEWKSLDATPYKNPPEKYMKEIRKRAQEIRQQKEKIQNLKKLEKQKQYNAWLQLPLPESYQNQVLKSVENGVLNFDDFTPNEFDIIEKILYKIYKSGESGGIHSISFPETYKKTLSPILIYFNALEYLYLPEHLKGGKRTIRLLELMAGKYSSLHTIIFSGSIDERPELLQSKRVKPAVVNGTNSEGE